MEWPKRPSNNNVNNNQLVCYDGDEEYTSYSQVLILNIKEWHGTAFDGFRT
jgi:hypothetical protein